MQEKKLCCDCNYSLMKPMNICLAPMKIGDPRRGKFVGPDTECFNNWYAPKRNTKIRGKISIDEMKSTLKGMDDEKN